MTADAVSVLVGSVIVAMLALGGVVLTSRVGFQSASLDSIVKQYQAVSADNSQLRKENDELRTERDVARADASRWRAAFEACEKRLPVEKRRKVDRDE